MSDSYRIGRLDTTDWSRLKSLRLRSAESNPEAFGSSLESMLSRPDEFWSQQVEQMACFTASHVTAELHHDVGLVRGVLDPNDSTHAWLLGMWVDPSARGQGIGELLAHAVLSWACEAQVSVVKLEVVENNHHARALYERLGFTPTGHNTPMPEPRSHLTEVEYYYPL